MRPKTKTSPRCAPRSLSEIMSACGFNVRLYRDSRVYISGYGRDIKAYLAPCDGVGPLPADGYALHVASSWRAPQFNGLRCKGIKHAILEDLYTARLITLAPPAKWQEVELDASHGKRPTIRPYETGEQTNVSGSETAMPARHARDPYAPLRELHQKAISA